MWSADRSLCVRGIKRKPKAGVPKSQMNPAIRVHNMVRVNRTQAHKHSHSQHTETHSHASLDIVIASDEN